MTAETIDMIRSYQIKQPIIIMIILMMSFSFTILSGCEKSIIYHNDGFLKSTKNENETEGNYVMISQGSDQTEHMEIKRLKLEGFSIIDKIGKYYYGYYSIETENGLDSKYQLIEENGSTKDIQYPKGVEDWTVASGDYVIMSEQYLYEWLCYTESTDSAFYEARLLKLDIQTGIVSVVEERKMSSPFVYMSKFDDTSFIFYTVSKAQSYSGKAEYATLTTAYIYNTQNDTYHEIISEIYEYDGSWENSTGVLIERFDCLNGHIYGIGRIATDNKFCFFLYEYDSIGRFISKKCLQGLAEIVGEEQFLEIHLVGDYLLFRTYETLSNYICLLEKEKVSVVCKGLYGQAQYGITSSNIYFIESNVDMNTAIPSIKYNPVYKIDIAKKTAKKCNYKIDISKPYFYEIKSTNDNKIIISYCKDGEYNPCKIVNYLVL